MRAHRQTEQEHQSTEKKRNHPPVWSKHICPVIHNTRDQTLHGTKLTADPNHQQHQKEQKGPKWNTGYGNNLTGKSKTKR